MKVTNGDIGYITNFTGKNIYIKFDDGEKMIPDTNKEIIDLAYAITVHKSQGSEYPYMIMPISEAHQFMLTRKLVYTAITRGKQKVILVGSKNAFEKALQENEKDKRYTDLSRKARLESA